MKIAIAAVGNERNAAVNPHFGKSRYFCIYDTDSQTENYIENPSAGEEQAGCKMVELLQKQNVAMVVAGRFGAKATDKFRTVGITLVTPDKEMTINSIINQINDK